MPSTPTPSAPTPPAPTGPTLAWVSSDLNVTVRGRIVRQQEPGTIEGVVLQLEEQGGVDIKHPALVSILTKPESQTLFNINTGEQLFTLSTPLIPDAEESADSSAAVLDDDDEDDPDGDVPSISALDSAPSSASASPSRSRSRTRPTPSPSIPPKKPTLITLHSTLLPFSSTPELESSSLYSRTFHIIIDGPSFPAPHFDPLSIVPPTPLVRPHAAGPEGLNGPAGVLNSPTLQRALLSPLLSPQRRASSQASDASVPPLNLGLSRTSRPSFTGGERPSGLRGGHHAASPARTRGLAAFVPPIAHPGSHAPTSSSSASPPHPVPDLPNALHSSLSSAAKKTAEEILTLRREHDLFVRRAKAELEVLEGRIEEFKAHGFAGLGEEGVVRGFKTKEEKERERVEKNKSSESGSGSGGTSSSTSASHSQSQSHSASRDRSRSTVPSGAEPQLQQDRSISRPRESMERGRPGWGAASAEGSSAQTLKATDMDESLSLRLRAQDEREEEERGRSRSRMRRGGAAGEVGEERRSRSRTKAVAEATRKAVEGAREKSASRDRGREGGEGRQRNGNGAEEGGNGRGTPRKQGESIPATLEEEDEDEGQGEVQMESEGKKEPAPTSSTAAASSTASTASNGLLAPPSTTAQPSSPSSASNSSSAPLAPSHPAPATPTFIPSKALVSVPEEEEEDGGGDGFSDLPPSRVESREPSRERGRGGKGGRGRNGAGIGEVGREGRRRERQDTGRSEASGLGEDDIDEDQPFEMDEDVDADADTSSLTPAPAHSTHRRPSPATHDTEPFDAAQPPSGPSNGSLSSGNQQQQQQQQQPISGSFKPGSFQRASALSASYAQLLTTHANLPISTSTSRTPSPLPPVPAPSSPHVTSTNPPRSESPLTALGSPATASRAADGLPPFSPPDAKSPVTTSAREDAQNASAASILERSVGAGVEGVRGKGRDGLGGSGPDPRDVRRGEQKIRDVLAMDVPSHRPLAGKGRRGSGSARSGGGGTYTPDKDALTSEEEDDDDDGNDSAEEGRDRVDDLQASISSLRSRPSAGSTVRSSSENFQVGSLPIALGRPSTVNAALSSWRPDPERLWVQEREKHRAASGGAGGRPEGPFSLQSGSGAAGTPKSGGAGEGTTTPAGWTGATQGQGQSQPVEIGSPAAASPAVSAARSITIGGMRGPGGGAGGILSSSLAQSLRAAPSASFSQRAEAEQRFSSAHHQRVGGARDQLPPDFDGEGIVGRAGGAGEEGDEEDEDEEEGFVPPHVVAERRERRDERYLSRSVSRR
ncbi:hypothetical protein JCM11251_006731 [Rhodosporidiobolus azoricus]